MGIGDTEKGWCQLAFIKALANLLDVDEIFSQEDYSLDDSKTSGDREPEDRPKYAKLHEDLDIDFEEYEAWTKPRSQVGPIVNKIEPKTLLFLLFTGFVEQAAVLDQAATLDQSNPEVYIGNDMENVEKGCRDRHANKLADFAVAFEASHDWVKLPRLYPDHGGFQSLVMGWKKKESEES